MMTIYYHLNHIGNRTAKFLSISRSHGSSLGHKVKNECVKEPHNLLLAHVELEPDSDSISSNISIIAVQILS